MSLNPEKLTDKAARWREEFQIDGETKVRERIALNNFGSPHQASLANQWFEEREARRRDEADSASSQREEKALELARDANDIAREANDKATTANRIAILAAIIAIVSAAIAFTSTSN